MKRIPDELIKEIRNTLDIVEVISKYVSLTRRGKNYWGLSPFRDDTNPSLSVSPDKQIYMDFATHEGGNVFTFLMKIESLSFVEAVIKGANLIGMDMSEYEGQTSAPIDPHKKELFSLMQEANDYYEYELNSTKGVQAKEYLLNRGYNEKTSKLFNIGLALNDSKLIDFLQAKGYENSWMLETDLARFHEEELKPVFYNRVLFPIHDEVGRVIGYSGRTLDPNSNVKYVNTKDTPLYNKSKVLYNYHRAKESARKQGFIIITEGVTDSIAFTRANHPNVVSLLGVACTNDHIKLVKQLSDSVILAFDGDKAGIEATYNIGKRLVEAHCKVSVWYNDSGMDPDELLKIQGESALDTGISDKLNWLDFVLNFAIANYGLNSYENRKKVATFFLKHIDAKDSFEKDYYLKELAKRTQFEVSSLEHELSGVVTVRKPKPKSSSKPVTLGCSLPEKRLLASMLLSRQAAYMYRDSLGYMIHPLANDMALMLLNLYRLHEEIEYALLYEQNTNDSIGRLINEVILLSESMSFRKEEVEENIALIKKNVIKQGINQLSKQIEDSSSIEDQVELLKKAMENMRDK